MRGQTGVKNLFGNRLGAWSYFTLYYDDLYRIYGKLLLSCNINLNYLLRSSLFRPPVFSQPAWRSKTRREYGRVDSAAASRLPTVWER
jgi:hypothetical protein